MALMVLGSSGLVGRELVARLSRDDEVVACDVTRPPEAFRVDSSSVTYVALDVTRLDQLIDVIHEHRVTAIATLAYIMGPLMTPTFADYLTADEVNVKGVINVFEAARLTGVSRVLFVSTVGTYGPQSLYGDRPVTEDDPLAPRSLYGRMKALNESLADRYAALYGIEAVKVRPSAILGAGSTIWPAKLIAPVAVGEPGEAPYAPEARDNIIAVEDLVELFTHLVTRPSLRHSTYLATGHNVSMSEIVEVLRDLLPKAEIGYREGAGQPTYAQRFDNSRALEEFDWRLTPVRDSIAQQINGVRKEEGMDPLAL